MGQYLLVCLNKYVYPDRDERKLLHHDCTNRLTKLVHIDAAPTWPAADHNQFPFLSETSRWQADELLHYDAKIGRERGSWLKKVKNYMVIRDQFLVCTPAFHK
jgi:hypothetical protein